MTTFAAAFVEHETRHAPVDSPSPTSEEILMDLKSVVLPFSGFYNTWHDQRLDDALEQSLSDSSGNPLGGKFADAWEHVDWKKAYTEYAKLYAEWLCLELKIAGMEFEVMDSPREYNFETDRIFVKLPLVSLYKIHSEVDLAILEQVAKEMFTSRSGFSSFYSPDIEDWPPFEEWDHNQMLALIEAYVRTEDLDLDSLMDDANCNGQLDNTLYSSCTEELHRLDKIAYYLRKREERKYRHLWPSLASKETSDA